MSARVNFRLAISRPLEYRWLLVRYRCRNARKGKCWNKATGLQELSHLQIGGAVAGGLAALESELDLLINRAREALDDHGLRRDQKARCQQIEQEASEALENLAKVAEKAQELPEIILERMQEWQKKQDRARADLEYLDRQTQLMAAPTRTEVEQRIESLVAQLKEMKRPVAVELKALAGRLEAVPHQQFGSNKVVLRARFELKLFALLPAAVRAALAGLSDHEIEPRFGTIPMLVDLFHRSTGPKHGLAALELSEQGLGPTAIGARLKISKRKANIAVQYGKALRAAGLTDPFIEMTEPPAAASRWRTHPSQDPQGDAKLPYA